MAFKHPGFEGFADQQRARMRRYLLGAVSIRFWRLASIVAVEGIVSWGVVFSIGLVKKKPLLGAVKA